MDCRNRMTGILAISMFTVCTAAAAMDMDAKGHPAPSYHDRLGGMVINHTVTVAGQDFYQHFIAIWREMDISDRHTISIHEQPSARFGSRVWVQFAQRRVFHTSLPPGRAAVRKISEAAAEITYDAIIEADVQQVMFKDSDLASDELR